MNLSITIHLEISLATVFLLANIPLYLQQVGWPT